MLLPLHMSIERSTDLPANQLSPASAGALIALIGFIAIAIYWRNRLSLIWFGGVWLLITLLPFCGVVPNYQGMAERYEYLPSMGLAIVVCQLASQSVRLARHILIGAIVAWVLWGAWRVNARSLDWRDEATLDRASLKATPNSAVLWYNLALAEANAGDVQSAIAHYGQALAANSRYEPAFINLANLLQKQGDYREAIGLLDRARALNPNDSDLWTALGNTYGQMGSLQNAARAYEKAAQLNPGSPQAAANLGTAFQRLGDLEKAKRQYERALSLDPHQVAVYCNLGMALFQQGNLSAAIDQLKKGLEIDPNYAAAYFDLGVLYEQGANWSLALEMYEKALELNPKYEEARTRLNVVRRKAAR
jgi:protein O-mannosyl-transferase